MPVLLPVVAYLAGVAGRWRTAAPDLAVIDVRMPPTMTDDGARAARELSEREHEVLALVAEGHSNAAIATRLRLAERTVESHMRAIFQKLRIPDSGDRHRRVLAGLTYLS
nr:hypothetical protein GCM10020063_005680 [Dactylosporangium thailandense]